MMYLVQSRKRGDAWRNRWKFDELDQAIHYYLSLRTFGDYRKRFVEVSDDGVSTITMNQLADLPWSVRD